LGIGLVPYSPLGRGLMTGTVTGVSNLALDDFRRRLPRFEQANLEHNVQMVGALRQVADRYGCTPAQVALAWLLAQGSDVVPIPGTKRRRWLEENVGAPALQLTPEDLTTLDQIKPAGERYADMSWVDRGTIAAHT
jgi:aryl-alcohol dehydrogenase-like predicted oxidoreductase